MNLFLMRHADAIEGERDDADRGLTSQGKHDAKLMGKLLRKIDEVPDLIIGSPFKRNTSTVKRVLRGLKDKHIPWIKSELVQPNVWAITAWEEIAKIIAGSGLDEDSDSTRVLVVSHGPLIQNLLRYITEGEPSGAGFGWHWQHGGIALVKPLNMQRKLHWFVTPRLVDREKKAFREAAIRLAENLLVDRRRKVVDKLILALAIAARRHFRRQLSTLVKNWTGTASSAQTALESLTDPKFAAAIDKAAIAGYEGGGLIAAGDLGIEPATTLGYQLSGKNIADSIDETTIERTLGRIKDALERGLTRQQTEKELRSMFREWASNLETSRAESIGVNEVSKAFNAGMLDQARAAGSLDVQKEWWADPGACDICDENVGETIELDEPFASGDLAPPAHPNCRCSLRLVSSSSSDEADVESAP